MEQVIEFANKCLNCKNKPCIKSCPMATDIPFFIDKIKKGDLEGAYNTLIENNLFTYICSKICPQEEQCQLTCTRGIKGEPIKIGFLEEYVNKWAKENNIQHKVKIKEKNGMKIAVVGSGPSGLSCAYELAKEGFNVTVFEKDALLGGILRYGVPEFRLPKNILNSIIEKLNKMDIKFVTSCKLGKDISIEKLKTEYEAIFLGLGAQRQIQYTLSEEKNEKIYNSADFLKIYNEDKIIENLGKVIVIGGGNVAMDVARCASELGAEEVTVVYRRDRASMPARKLEVEDAIEHGIKFEFLTKVINSYGKEKIECIKTKLENGKAVDIEGTNYFMEANTIVFAIGSLPDEEVLGNIFEFDNNFLKIDENGKTNIDGIFAGGDLVNSKATVCIATATGRKAAFGIIDYIRNKIQ